MNKSVKRVASGLLITLLGASLLSGCGSKSDEGGSSDGNKKVEIEFFSNKTENINTYKSLIAEFEKENPDIKINFQSPPEADTVLKVRISKNQIPDVMSMGGSAQYREFVGTAILKDFSDDPLLDNVHPAYIDMIGKILGDKNTGTYGIPYAANANGIIYNKEKLDKLGIQPPKTWDELIQALDKAKAASETPIFFTLKDPWTGMVILNSMAANLQGENFAPDKNAGKTTFKQSYGEIADKMIQLIDYGHKDNFGVGYADGNAAFAKGNGVFYMQGVWAIPDILKANPDAKIGVSAFPATNDPANNKLVSGVDILLTSYKDTKHPEEAQKFIEFLLKKENAQKYIDEQTAFSTLKDVFQNNPIMDGFKTNFENGAITSFPDHYYQNGMKAENIVQEFFMKKDKDKFLDTMDKEWDKVLNRQ
ncbi:extracellular solute-binding protein [Paenibacillus sp. BR2-3]|uniref:ABC transporter substrate-binding protein n=1 Tax=Paenibacillus sp. BR2-3 TaxID=3048494 RepID=UPI003977C7F5